MADVERERPQTRSGRCANHPGVARVGHCDRCGRALCIACAIPVRGRVIGPECLSKVVDRAVSDGLVAALISRRGDQVAAVGFAVVLILSVLPWSRGLDSGLLSAWTPHWSLVAIATALGGLLVSVLAWRRSKHPVVETGLEALLAVCVGAAALLHARFPPSLSESSVTPLVAILAAVVALGGAVAKMSSLRRVAAGTA